MKSKERRFFPHGSPAPRLECAMKSSLLKRETPGGWKEKSGAGAAN